MSDAGVIDLSRVPNSVELNERQERVRHAALSGNTVVEPSLAGAIRSVEWPCDLDFETVTTFLPLYPGHGCHQQVLTQFSIHCRESPDGGLSHVDFLAEARRDCQRELAETLIQSLGDRGSIVVYSAFEATRISAPRDAFPELAEGLQLILGRLVDLLPLIRDHVYHPSFGGSFSIKRVLPALVAELSYAELEVADGYTAVARFTRMARGEIYGEEATRTREHLLDSVNGILWRWYACTMRSVD